MNYGFLIFFFFQAEDGIRDLTVTGVQTCALPIFSARNLDEWREAASLMGMFQQNFVAGDRYGNAMYVRMGLTPRRAEGVDPTRPGVGRGAGRGKGEISGGGGSLKKKKE